MTSMTSSLIRIRDLYARMLLTRVVDSYICRLQRQGQIEFTASSRGHEAAQVGSAVCVEVGKDFTVPYYRDLGVVLTIGMTPYEVFRSYLHPRQTTIQGTEEAAAFQRPMQHWGYYKHNIVTGSAPVATQLLHAAGIAFACKLRKAAAVTVAYCGDGAASEAEPDFLEALRFATLHHLPIIFIYEQDNWPRQANETESTSSTSPYIQTFPLPEGLSHRQIDGMDIVAVYTAMQAAMQDARAGRGPVLLEMLVQRPQQGPGEETEQSDPLLCCQRYLQVHNDWDSQWALQLATRIETEVERALQDALSSEELAD